jgi:bifunctional DNase/RNase
VIEMLLQRILISETSDQQYIFLKEKDGDRTFPIVIGFYEALAIDRFVRENSPPRPMTHDLLANVLTAVGAKVEKVEVTNLKESTFYAVVHIRTADGRKAEVDARPSDAIALATAVKARIFVSEKVLEDAAVQ